LADPCGNQPSPVHDWFNGLLNGPVGDQACNFAKGTASAPVPRNPIEHWAIKPCAIKS
jgi:hypothetical protein